MRKAPSPKTIKKLFAFSNNLCAFPDCPQNIVDKIGNLIGEVCHIEAAEVGGERFNPMQTDAQRASFENLILFCANHHKVTNNIKVYTVEVLKDMKKKHESKSQGKKYKPNEKIIGQAIEKVLAQSNVNSGSGLQHNYQANRMTVNNGMTAADVVTIVQSLFDANFPKLVLIAREEAAKNIAKFETVFREEVSKKLTLEQLIKFTDPDIQVVLYQAVYSGARKDSDLLRKLLSDLVIQRVKNDDNELKQKVLNEAVTTVGKITRDQLKILTICFLVKDASMKDVLSWESLKKSLEESFKPFIGFKGSHAEIFHLQYAGCGKVEEVFSFNLENVFRQSYGYAFQKKLSLEEVNSLGVEGNVLKQILKSNGNGIIFNANTKRDFANVLKVKGVDGSNIERLTNLYEQKLLTAEEIKTKLKTELPWTVELFERFEKTSLNHLKLTSVGMAIAIAYYEQVIGKPLNIDIWIN